MRRRIQRTLGGEREAGNALLMAFFLTVVMAGLSSAQFMIVHKNIRQSEFYASREILTSYAESGLQLALHDLRFAVSGNLGKIGTETWNAGTDDVGADGAAATGDAGEADGLPTVGEPNVNPVAVGEAVDGVQMIAYSQPTAWADVSRVVATAFNDTSSKSVEAYTLEVAGLESIPRVGAVYVNPSTVLDLKGNAFLIDGNDHNPDGSAGPAAAVHGIATVEDPANPGQNMNDLIDQIPSARYDQVIGLGATNPSVGETSEDFDINSFFASFLSGVDRTVAPGAHSNVTWGDSSNYEVTYVDGDLHLSGTGSGAGVLLVDGNLNFSGEFTWEGIVIVRGDTRQTGGGSAVHIFGSLVIGSSITVIDDPDLTVIGNSELRYSSTALDQVDTILQSIPAQGLTVLYWGDVY